MKDQSFLRRISIILFVVMLVLFIVHVQILVHFNRQVVTVHGNDNSGSSYMEINDRENSTSSWLKRGFQLTEDKTVDLTGQTVDETLYNNSGDVIQNWGLQINITGDCFINQAWNGEVEIHQFAGSEDETVQRLNLQDYKCSASFSFTKVFRSDFMLGYAPDGRSSLLCEASITWAIPSFIQHGTFA